MTTSLNPKQPPRRIQWDLVAQLCPCKKETHISCAYAHYLKCRRKPLWEYTRSRALQRSPFPLEMTKSISIASWQPLQETPRWIDLLRSSKYGRTVTTMNVSIVPCVPAGAFRASAAWTWDWESATTSTRLFRDTSWREYIPGRVRSERTAFRSSFSPIPRRFAANASVLVRSWGDDFKHSMQHLLQERRKTKPPKAPQMEQFYKQKVANNFEVDVYRAAPVLRKARNASRPCSMMGW